MLACLCLAGKMFWFCFLCVSTLTSTKCSWGCWLICCAAKPMFCFVFCYLIDQNVSNIIIYLEESMCVLMRTSSWWHRRTKSRDHKDIWVHPVGTESGCAKCCDILLINWKLSAVLGARGKVRGSPKSLRFIFLGTTNNWTKFHSNSSDCSWDINTDGHGPDSHRPL